MQTLLPFHGYCQAPTERTMHTFSPLPSPSDPEKGN